MDKDIKAPEQTESASAKTDGKDLHETLAADAGIFLVSGSRNSTPRDAANAGSKESGSDIEITPLAKIQVVPTAKPDQADNKSKDTDAETTDSTDDDEFVRETLKFPEEFQEKLSSLIDAEKIMPMLSPVMENQMDDLMSDGDREADEVRNRLSDDLEHFDGQAKLDRADNALKEFRTAFYAVNDEAHREAIYNYLSSNSAEIPAAVNEYPGLKEKIEELGKSQSDPDFNKAAEIQTEAHNKLEALAKLKEDYAKHLAETNRSGKALVMIVQAKEIRTEINRRE